MCSLDDKPSLRYFGKNEAGKKSKRSESNLYILNRIMLLSQVVLKMLGSLIHNPDLAEVFSALFFVSSFMSENS